MVWELVDIAGCVEMVPCSPSALQTERERERCAATEIVNEGLSAKKRGLMLQPLEMLVLENCVVMVCKHV